MAVGLMVWRGFDAEHVQGIAGGGVGSRLIGLPKLAGDGTVRRGRWIWRASEATDMRLRI